MLVSIQTQSRLDSKIKTLNNQIKTIKAEIANLEKKKETAPTQINSRKFIVNLKDGDFHSRKVFTVPVHIERNRYKYTTAKFNVTEWFDENNNIVEMFWEECVDHE